MSLSCIYCEKDAKFVFEGTSLCKEHPVIRQQLKTMEHDSEDIIVMNYAGVPG